ncbi:MAG: hypothetical protein M1538_03635 [Candidatus Marsarchaeota archaeon]|jgi:hypothetical protein|nr:hypothetical protein [Candidatus Marsarchaeota archaeon]
MFDFLKPKNITINGINIKWEGFVHSLKEQSKFSKNNILIKIPFKNNFSDSNTKNRDININNIAVDNPFTILKVIPNLPITIKSNTSIILKIKLKSPDYNYEGPVSFEFE